MRKEQGRTLAQMTLAANTPMMLKAGLVEGDTNAGVLASGQVVGVIDDLPTCEELLDRVWGYEVFGDDRLVDVHVGRLRRKIERDPANPKHLLTVRGLGYKLQA